ncbi:MAG: F0F1 ATP synthase subunit epsilon [Nitrospinae bacterium]|nr:F0F1 ATP synthase subunit epsilon [Nitrospinota bacterium]
MTDARLQLDVVTPEGVVVATEVDEVVAPGPGGEFGVLPGHTPFLVLLDVGEVRYQSERGEERLSVAHGFAEVTPDRVIILAESCERPDEIDVDRARAALERAEARLAGDTTEIDHARAEAALRRAINRIRMGAEK